MHLTFKKKSHRPLGSEDEGAMEDGDRVSLSVPRGHLATVVPAGSASIGQTVRVRLDGAVRFPAADALPTAVG